MNGNQSDREPGQVGGSVSVFLRELFSMPQAAHRRLFNRHCITHPSGSGANGRMAPDPHYGSVGWDVIPVSLMDSVVVQAGPRVEQTFL